VSSEDAERLEGLLEATDKATYEAKLQGEGRIFVP
jgi:GGDEF domain-containing protein